MRYITFYFSLVAWAKYNLMKTKRKDQHMSWRKLKYTPRLTWCGVGVSLFVWSPVCPLLSHQGQVQRPNGPGRPRPDWERNSRLLLSDFQRLFNNNLFDLNKYSVCRANPPQLWLTFKLIPNKMLETANGMKTSSVNKAERPRQLTVMRYLKVSTQVYLSSVSLLSYSDSGGLK